MMPRYTVVTGEEFVERYLASPFNSNIFKRIEHLDGSAYSQAEHVLAVVAGDKIIGDLSIEQNPNNEDELWLMHVEVDPEYRNQGVGRRLMLGACDHVRHLGLKKRLLLSSLSEDGQAFLPGVIAEMDDIYPDLLLNLQIDRDPCPVLSPSRP